MSKREPLAHHVVAEEPVPARLLDGVPETLGRERVLAADVDVAAIARRSRSPAIVSASITANGSCSITHAVLERAGLGFVGVADEVVRPGRLLGDGLPLHPVGNAAPPRPMSLASVTSRMTPSGPSVDEPAASAS